MRKPIRKLGGWGGGRSLLDPGVRDIVLDLAAHGFRTFSSCEGGVGHQYPRGVITFEDIGELSKGDIEGMRDLVKSHTDVPFRILRQKDSSYYISFLGPLREVYPEGYIDESWNVSPEEFEREWTAGEEM